MDINLGLTEDDREAFEEVRQYEEELLEEMRQMGLEPKEKEKDD